MQIHIITVVDTWCTLLLQYIIFVQVLPPVSDFWKVIELRYLTNSIFQASRHVLDSPLVSCCAEDQAVFFQRLHNIPQFVSYWGCWGSAFLFAIASMYVDAGVRVSWNCLFRIVFYLLSVQHTYFIDEYSRSNDWLHCSAKGFLTTN